MENDLKTLSYRQIFVFWLPLALTWLFWGSEMAYLSALIARLPEPKYNLAALGISFSLLLFIEAPVMVLMSATTALVKDYTSYKKVRNFSLMVVLIVTFIVAVVILPPVFRIITENIFNISSKVANLSHLALLIMLPLPIGVGMRRFYNGVMIRQGRTRLVAYGTVIRMVIMATTGFLLFIAADLPGSLIGATSLTSGVLIELIIARQMTRGIFRKIIANKDQDEEAPAYGEITRFFIPLALMMVIYYGIIPIINAFMGSSRMSLESLAVFPVVNSLIAIFNCIGFSYHEAALAKISDNKSDYKMLQRFGFGITIAVTSILMVIGLTDGFVLWFHNISGLSFKLTEFVHTPMIILILVPACTSVSAYLRAVIVMTRRTAVITQSTIIDVSMVALTMFITTVLFDWIGVIAGAIAMVLGRLMGVTYLLPAYLKEIKKIKQSV